MPQMSLLASPPDDKYAEVGSKQVELYDGKIVAEDVVLRVRPLPEGSRDRPRYLYQTFCPGCPPNTNLTFIGGGWDAVFED